MFECTARWEWRSTWLPALPFDTHCALYHSLTTVEAVCSKCAQPLLNHYETVKTCPRQHESEETELIAGAYTWHPARVVRADKCLFCFQLLIIALRGAGVEWEEYSLGLYHIRIVPYVPFCCCCVGIRSFSTLLCSLHLPSW